MADPCVQSAIPHWAPRFVANGIALTGFQEVIVDEHLMRAAANYPFSKVVLVVDYEQIRAKCRTQEEARRSGATLSLDGIAGKITCPLFIVAGKLDRIAPWRDGERRTREAKGPVEFRLIEDGNHVANNRGHKYRTQSADWIARQLGLSAV